MPDAAGGTSTKSLGEWRTLAADFHRGFSDVKVEVLLQVAEGNYVCSRWRLTARHTGAFGELAPTGKTSTWTGVHTDRYEGGKLVESWVDWDKYSFLEGLGRVRSCPTIVEQPPLSIGDGVSFLAHDSEPLPARGDRRQALVRDSQATRRHGRGRCPRGRGTHPVLNAGETAGSNVS
jgi:predicted ester cyclase